MTMTLHEMLLPSNCISECLVALQQWETAWQEIELHQSGARIDAPIPKGHHQRVEFSFGQHFVVICEGYGRSAGYSFLGITILLITLSSSRAATISFRKPLDYCKDWIDAKDGTHALPSAALTSFSPPLPLWPQPSPQHRGSSLS
jgi:hypothetical protein